MSKTIKWTQEIKDTTELVDQLAYALFEDEKKYAKEFEEWRDEHGVFLDINDANEDVWNALPSGLLFWLMKKHYQLNTDDWNGGKVTIHKAIQDFWDEVEKLANTSYNICLNFYEWSSIKEQEYEHGKDDGYEEFHKEQFVIKDNLVSSDVRDVDATDVRPSIARSNNPYVCTNVDVTSLPRRMYTCTGHMEVKTSDV